MRLCPPFVRTLRGCLTSVLSFFVLGTFFVLAINAVFTPWGYYLGGHFHLLPSWRGVGRIHTASSGDYLLFVRMQPGRYSRVTGTASVAGFAWLCTPRGERIPLRFSGIMPKLPPLHSTGESIHAYFYYRPFWLNFATNRRPQFDLYGSWGDRQLNLDDYGSFSRAFRPDFTPYEGRDYAPTGATSPISVTLNEDGRFYLLNPSCPASF
jgi:hypothetical protein